MHKRSPWRTLAAGSIGNFGEIYDFAVFGFSVPILASHFFPGGDRTAAILNTFAVYAVAFLARPLGGLVFGMTADRIGRVKVMAMTVWLMALGTAAMGLLPTYAEIGLAAPILLVMCRVAQGFALGGETSGSTSFIVEAAPDDRRGQWLGFTLIFSHLPNAVVAGLLILLQSIASQAQFAQWIWRVPFLAGGLIGIVGFWLRRDIEEPEEFRQAARKEGSGSPLRDTFRVAGVRGMLNVLMIQPIYSVGAYLLLGFMYTFLVRVAKLDAMAALTSNGVAVIALSLLLPLGGMLSDRYGRKRILTLGCAWLALFSYPAIQLAASGTFAGAVFGQMLFVVGLGLQGGASFVAAPEFFPTSFRATGHAISYQINVALFGGTSPFIAAYLTQRIGTPVAPAYYVSAIAFACLIATQFVPETRGIRLRTSVDELPQETTPAGLRDLG